MAAEIDRPGDKSSAEPRKVLVVDDEPFIRRVAQVVLAKMGGWQVFLAATGEEALEIANRESPEVIVLDVMLPGIDGVETLRRLRAAPTTARAAVVMMTAQVFKHQTERYHAGGAVAVLAKPFDPAELVRVVDAVKRSA